MNDPILLLHVFRVLSFRSIDGDTVAVELDRSFGDRSVKSIRLLGLDTPENTGSTREVGRAVTNLVGRWFELRLTKPGVHIWSVQLDSRGRSLARVYPADQSVFSATLNNFLLDNGLALPYDGEGKRPVWTGEQLGHAKLTAERILAEWQSVTTGTNKT